MGVTFTDNSASVKAAINDAIIAFLYEAAESLKGQVQQNSRVATGDLKGSWTYKVDESKCEAVVGSPLENAIWEEFGTGEYALYGNGRKGGWTYVDDKGKGHHTYGKSPNRALFNAFNTLKPAFERRAEEILKGMIK